MPTSQHVHALSERGAQALRDLELPIGGLAEAENVEGAQKEYDALVACHRERGEDPPSMCNFVLNKLKTQGARLMESVAFEILLPPEASVAEPLGVEADAPGNAAHGPARIPAALPAQSAPYGPARTAAVRDVPAAEGSLMWGDVVGNEDC
jgi:hypothetical protein